MFHQSSQLTQILYLSNIYFSISSLLSLERQHLLLRQEMGNTSGVQTWAGNNVSYKRLAVSVDSQVTLPVTTCLEHAYMSVIARYKFGFTSDSAH